jgi:hypothetical protein
MVSNSIANSINRLSTSGINFWQDVIHT